jgi:hypothetical protein
MPSPGTGARPGNVIGTGSSLPRSDNANNITPGGTHSDIAPNLPSPPIGENATSRDYLASAHVAHSRPHRRGAAVAGDSRDAGT